MNDFALPVIKSEHLSHHSALGGFEFPSHFVGFPVAADQFPVAADQFAVAADQFVVAADQFAVSAGQFAFAADQFAVAADQFPVAVVGCGGFWSAAVEPVTVCSRHIHHLAPQL